MKTDTLCRNAALEYIKHGIPVFPICWPNTDGTCDCGRKHQGKKIGKAPLTRHGLKDATVKQARVEEYWSRWPNAGIALATDCLVVLDFDADNGGLESKTIIEAQYGLPRTRTHRTGGGGLHYLYRSPDGTDIRNAVNLGGYLGVDLRANGGYIVAPPSLHKNGNRYEVIDNSEIIPAPTWLTEIATKKKPIQTANIETPLIFEGQRNSTLSSLAGTMRSRGMTETEIFAALTVTNNERCQPPLPEDEVEDIAKSAARYAPTFLTEFFQAPNAVFELDINKHEKLVYLYICRCTNQGAPAFPGYGRIAKSCSMSRPIAVEAINNLVEKGLIGKTRRQKSNKSWESNTYHVLPFPLNDIYRVK
jgi:putative DNA primase/helicase